MLRTFLSRIIIAPTKNVLNPPCHLSAIKMHYSNNVHHASPPPKPNKHYDIIIVGGGPAGLSMACAIGKFRIK